MWSLPPRLRSGDSEPLPLIESKLRSLDVYSAWRLLPDWQVGIVRVESEQQLDKVVALVSRTAVDRVGVSAQFNDLREAPQALHFRCPRDALRSGHSRRCGARRWPVP